MPKKYLITGGAGFIGSHLAEQLLNQGHEVFVIDNFSTGSNQNIEHLKKFKRFGFINSHVESEENVPRYVQECDTIYHAAAAVGVKKIMDEPLKSMMTNLDATQKILWEAFKYGKKVFIFSTSECYGKNTNVPFKEESDSVFGDVNNHRWSYACSKLMDEHMALGYVKEHESQVIIVRLFNTVGPRQSSEYGMVIPKFVQAALNDEPMKIYGSGAQTRCFAHVLDVVDALIKLDSCDEAVGQVINIGNKFEINIRGLASMIGKTINPTSCKLVTIPYEEVYPQGFEDMSRRIPCLDKIEKLINYKPTRDLNTIIQDVIDYYRVNV